MCEVRDHVRRGMMDCSTVQAPGSPVAAAVDGAMSATLRTRHAPQPSFSDMVGHDMAMEGVEDSELTRRSEASSVRSMPSFDRFSPRRGGLMNTSEGPAGVSAVRRQGSQPETPTLVARAAPPAPEQAILRRNPASRPAGSSSKAGPTSEGQIDPTAHTPDMAISPFDSVLHPGEDMHGNPVDDTYTTEQLTASMQPLAPPGGGSSMQNAGSGQTLASHAVYVPPPGQAAAATPASVHFEVSSNSGAPLSVRRNMRPAPLVIDNPADAVSVAASSHHNTVRYEQRDDGVAIDAVANDRTVVDAEEEFGRVNTVAGMPSETVVGLPSRFGVRTDGSVEQAPLTAGPIQPLKWWVSRGGEDGVGAATWLSTRKRAPRTETWYDSEAILSRKPSVRFRRTVDLMMPVVNEEVRTHAIDASDVAIWPPSHVPALAAPSYSRRLRDAATSAPCHLLDVVVLARVPHAHRVHAGRGHRERKDRNGGTQVLCASD